MECQNKQSMQIVHRALYANRDTTIGSVCSHLRHHAIDQILVCDRQGQQIGFVPLSHVLRLTARDPRYCTQLLCQLNIDAVAEALEATIAYRCATGEHWENIALVREQETKWEVHRALVIVKGDRSLVSALLDSDAACVVVSEASVVSRSLIRQAREQETTLLFTKQSMAAAVWTLLMRIPLFAMMVRQKDAFPCVAHRISL